MKRNLFLIVSIAVLTVISAIGFVACESPTDTIADPIFTPSPAQPAISMGPDGSYNVEVTENVYFLAPDGSDTEGDGTKANPWFTFKKAQEVLVPGDTVYLRGGIYFLYGEDCEKSVNISGAATTGPSYGANRPAIVLRVSGEEGAPITYATYPPDMAEGNRAIIDLNYANIERATGEASATTAETAISFGWSVNNPGTASDEHHSTDWIHLYGFDIRGLPGDMRSGRTSAYNTIWLYNGNNNTIEFLRVHDNGGSGLFLPGNYPCKNNLIKNCDFFNNHTGSGYRSGSIDGIGNHPGLGATGNVIYGCRMWFNEDDGTDSIQNREQVVIDHCWSFWNGWYLDETAYGDVNENGLLMNVADNQNKYNDPEFYARLDYSRLRDSGGNRGGFKIGGIDMTGAVTGPTVPDEWPHQVARFSLCVGNAHSGFNNNHNVAGPYFFNNTAYRNGNNNFMFRTRFDSSSQGRYVNTNAVGVRVKNNVSYRLDTVFNTGLPSAPSRGPAAAEFATEPIQVEWLDFGSGDIENNSWTMADNGAKLTQGWVNRSANTLGHDESPLNHTFLDIIQNGRGITDVDFVSFDENEMLKPRNADGSLPAINFMRPVAGGKADGIGFTAEDTNEDGFGKRWMEVGARPWL